MITEILVSVPAICLMLVAMIVMGAYVSDHESQLAKLHEKLYQLNKQLEELKEQQERRELAERLKSIEEAEHEQ